MIAMRKVFNNLALKDSFEQYKPIESNMRYDYTQCPTSIAWILNVLSFSPIVHIGKDGSCYYDYIKTDYYINNNDWEADHFFGFDTFLPEKSKGGFARLKKRKTDKPYEGKGYINKHLYFTFNNPRLNLEIKYVFHVMIFSKRWSLNTAFYGDCSFMKFFAEFMNKNYPSISSIEEFTPKLFQEYETYIRINRHCKAVRIHLRDKYHYARPGIIRFPVIVYKAYNNAISEYLAAQNPDSLWDRDVWYINDFRYFGLDDVASKNSTIIFNEINNNAFKAIAKKYAKEVLLTHTRSWSSTASRISNFTKLANYITEVHPDWTDFKALNKEDIIGLSEYIITHRSHRANQKELPAADYIANKISDIRTMLQDMQLRNFEEAPKENIYKIIHTEYTITNSKIDKSAIKYIPESVINQLFNHFDKLADKWRPIILTMFYTGLRINDVLELKTECLTKECGQPIIKTNIRKTKIIDHRQPIPKDFAIILQNHINKVTALTNDYSNPEHYIFVHLEGSRRGKPYTPSSVVQALNELAIKYKILDEDGTIYHFKNHAFRHTYAVRLINNGSDLMTVQELLGHRSPEMTLVYAELLEDTKFKKFSEAVRNGAFEFSTDNGEIVSMKDASPETLKAIWLNYKINAIDTPYGTCLQRKNGRCSFASQPPCLTCNNGKPCTNLCIGAFNGDNEKYDILIDTAKRMEKLAKDNDREDMANENNKLIQRYTEIKMVLDKGGIIYGHVDRLNQGGSKK